MIDVVGEALMDGHDDGASVHFHPGGGPFNTAVALGRLGVPVAFRPPLSTDRFGDRLAALLLAAGVVLDGAGRCDAPTPLAIVTPDGSGDVDYRFYLQGTAFEAIRDTVRSAEAVATFVGSLGLALDPPGATVAKLAAEAARTSALVIDPNVRPAAIGRPDPYRRRLEVLASVAALVKLSRADGTWLYPQLDTAAVALRLLELGASCVVVTDGAKGASGWTRSASARVGAPHVAVVDTIGAGDAFTAGFLASLWRRRLLARDELASIEQEPLASALADGAAAGAAQCERASAWGPTVSDIERLIEREGKWPLSSLLT